MSFYRTIKRRNFSPSQLSHQSLQRAEQEELAHNLAHHAATQQFPPHHVMQLQRTIGNQATSQLITQKSPSPTIQRIPVKLKLMEYMCNKHHGKAINKLATHIYEAIIAIEVGAWGDAYKRLYDKEMAGSLGHHITLHFKAINPTGKTQAQIDKEVNLAISKGMYFSGKLDLPDVAVYANLNSVKNPENDAHLAQMVLPVVLEEWIHMFQHLIRGVLSDGTKAFMETKQVIDNQKLPEGSERWNMNEVDIYAIYKELGWDHVLSAFKSRYPERIKYEEFTEVLKRGELTRRTRRKRQNDKSET